MLPPKLYFQDQPGFNFMTFLDLIILAFAIDKDIFMEQQEFVNKMKLSPLFLEHYNECLNHTFEDKIAES